MAPRTQDEDHDGDEEDEEEEEEEKDDDEYEVVGKTPSSVGGGMSSMAEALEGVMAKMLEREREIAALEGSREVARARNLQLAGGLLRLRDRSQGLEGHQAHLRAENTQLKAEADTLWMLPALFGVTPLQMVDITLREQQQGQGQQEEQKDEQEHWNLEEGGQQQVKEEEEEQEEKEKEEEEEEEVEGDDEKEQQWLGVIQSETQQYQEQEELWENKIKETDNPLEENDPNPEKRDFWRNECQQNEEEEQENTEQRKWITPDLWDGALGEKWQPQRIWVEQGEEGGDHVVDDQSLGVAQESSDHWHQDTQEEHRITEPDLSALLGDS